LREDHDALRDCLCAAGLLTPGEVALHRQARLRAARFHGFCRNPALVQLVASIAGEEAMCRFSAASSSTSSACRSILLMNSSPAVTSAVEGLELSSQAVEQVSRPGVAASLFSRLFSGESSPATANASRLGPEGPASALLGSSMKDVQAAPATSSQSWPAPEGSPVVLAPSQETRALSPLRVPGAGALVLHAGAGNGTLQHRQGISTRFLARLMSIGWRGVEEREKPSVDSLMQLKEVVRNIGHVAGATAAFQLCETCRGAAEGLRGILPLLSQEAPFIYVCGGSCGIAMDSAERFSPRTGQWETLPSMCMPRRACATASTGGRFYVMGGVDVPRFTSSVFKESPPWVYEDKYRPECFDPVLNRWELMPPMNRPYTHAAATSLGGFVYVFGGLSFGNVLDQAQRFDPTKDQWECLEPMPTPRFECTAASTKGRIYVLGGSNICGEPLSVAECYNPATGQWKPLPRMRQARYGCAAASLKGLVYVFGGHGVWENLSEGEFYDVEADRWCPLQPMSAQRNHCGAAAAGGRIYVFGGHTNGQDIMTIECLDPENGCWEVVALMPKPRSHCMTVTVQP